MQDSKVSITKLITPEEAIRKGLIRTIKDDDKPYCGYLIILHRHKEYASYHPMEHGSYMFITGNYRVYGIVEDTAEVVPVILIWEMADILPPEVHRAVRFDGWLPPSYIQNFAYDILERLEFEILAKWRGEEVNLKITQIDDGGERVRKMFSLPLKYVIAKTILEVLEHAFNVDLNLLHYKEKMSEAISKLTIGDIAAWIPPLSHRTSTGSFDPFPSKKNWRDLYNF